MYTNDLASAAYNGFNKLWENRDNDQQTRIAIEGIQRGIQCCGASNGPSDWGTSIPASCCAEGQTCTVQNSHPTGCARMIKDFVNQSGLIIAWVAVVFAGIELVGVIFACCCEYT
jgi:hypothetical protein